MKQSKLVVIFLLSIMVLTTAQSIFAVEGSMGKTSEEKETYRAEMREKKAEERAAYKAELQAKREELAKKRQAEREEKKAARQAEREEKREKREAERQERIAQKIAEFVEVLTEKVGKYYERLSKLSEKLATRIVELKEKGLNMTTAEAKLVVADKKLEDAYKNALAIVDEIAETDVSSQDVLGQIISKVKELKNPFKEALEAYKEVVKEIRRIVTESEERDILGTPEPKE